MRTLLLLSLSACVNFAPFRERQQVTTPPPDDETPAEMMMTTPPGPPPPSGMTECVPETDAAFCARTGRICGAAPDALDNCGTTRSAVACGDCANGKDCVNNACVCPQSDTAFCDAAERSCGSFTGPDACGEMRTATCGSCVDGSTCSSGHCTHVCGEMPETIGSQAEVGLTGNATHLMAASPDFDTLLVDLTTPSGTCSDNRANHLLRFADAAPGPGLTLVTINVADLADFDIRGTESLTMLGDRMTIVGFSSDRAALISKWRTSAVGVSPATFEGTYTVLTSGGIGPHPYAPVVSADGLTLLYANYDVTETVIDRIMYASRHTAAEPFSTPVDVTAAFTVASKIYRPSGISTDSATVFAHDNINTFVWERANAFSPYVGIVVPPAAGYSGFRTKPNRSCSHFITSTIGGTGTTCADIRVYDQTY